MLTKRKAHFTNQCISKSCIYICLVFTEIKLMGARQAYGRPVFAEICNSMKKQPQISRQKYYFLFVVVVLVFGF